MKNKITFPPIESKVAEYKKEKDWRECYVFQSESDPYCPIVIHFILINKGFRKEVAPGNYIFIKMIIQGFFYHCPHVSFHYSKTIIVT